MFPDFDENQVTGSGVEQILYDTLNENLKNTAEINFLKFDKHLFTFFRMY